MKYVLYCRKSSESEDRQTLSIESQKLELTALAEKDNLAVYKTLFESQSAKEPGRPVFAEMMKLISSGKVDAILCWKLDRLARNPIDGGQIQWMLQKGIIQSIRTFDREYLPKDNVLLMNVELGMANQYVRDLSENIKRGNRTKLEKGDWPSYAPIGYKNDRENKKIVVNKKIAHYIERLFELYATGKYGFEEISDILFAEGFRTKSGKKIYRGSLHRLLTNTFYYGVMYRAGQYYKGNHVPTVSYSLWKKANDLLQRRTRKQNEKHLFAFRGFLKCASCGCSLTASKKKGHIYYYCTNSKGMCNEHTSYIRSEDMAIDALKIISRLAVSKELIDGCYKAKKEQGTFDEEVRQKSIQNIQNELTMARARQERLVDGYVQDLIPEDVYKAKMEALSEEQAKFAVQIEELEKENEAGQKTLERVYKAFLTAHEANKLFLKANEEKKRNYLEKLLWNLNIQNKKVASYQLKEIFQPLIDGYKITTFSQMSTHKDSNLEPSP